MTALSIATAAISFGVGSVAQLLVKATPFDGDPRSVSGTHVLYTVKELRSMKDDKERIDAYYNKRADLHDVLESVVETRDPAQAYVKLKDKKDTQLLTKAIKEFYPKAAVPDAPAPPLAVAVPLPPAPSAPPETAKPIVPLAVAVPVPAPSAPPGVFPKENKFPEDDGYVEKLRYMREDEESTTSPPKAPMLGGGARPMDAGHLQFGGEMRPLVLPAAPEAVAVGL